MSASSSEAEPQEIWHPQPERDQVAPDPALLSWLEETGLLTSRLRRVCGDRFRLRVLRDATVRAGTRREVGLFCGSRACIYAITDMPAGTLEAHPWLARLGDDPLGETLQKRADVSRSAFEYALLDTSELPDELGAAASAVWARRSEFLIGAAGLTVTELFLPALLECERQHLRIAG